MIDQPGRDKTILHLQQLESKHDPGYLSERIDPLGLTDVFQIFPYRSSDFHHYFHPDKSGNLLIHYPSGRDQLLQSYPYKVKRGKYKSAPVQDEELRPIVRKRYRPGLEPQSKEGKVRKYDSPPGAPAPLFIPVRTLNAIRKKQKIRTLYIVEGELKAAAGDRHGLFIVGITGIQNFTSGGILIEELEHCISVSMADNVVFLFDSDLFDLSSSLSPDIDPTKRPRNFWSSAKRFKERIQLMPARPEIWMAWPIPGEKKLGLDDLFIDQIGPAPDQLKVLEADYWKPEPLQTTMANGTKILDLTKPDQEIPAGRRIKNDTAMAIEAGIISGLAGKLALSMGWQVEPIYEEENGRIERVDLSPALQWVAGGRRIVKDLESLIAGPGSRGRWFQSVKISVMSDHQLKSYWGLNSPEVFYSRYKEKLIGWSSFRWGRDTYNITPDGVELQDAEKVISLENKGGQLYSKQGNVRKLIGSFTWSSDWHLSGSREGYLLDTVNSQGAQLRILVSSSDLGSVQSFRTIMLRHGLFWEGSQNELMRAIALACSQAKHAESVDVLGWQIKGGFWMWANGAANGNEFIEAEKSGFVEVSGDHYFIPASSDILADDGGLESSRRVKHSPRRTPSLEKWLDMASSVYGVDRAVLGLALVSSSIFADVVRLERRFFPLFFLFGPPQMGKSTFARSLQAFFGEPLPPVNMESGGTTVAGMQRVLARTRNVPAFFDEFSARTQPWLGDQLKNTFDGVSGTQGVKSGGNETKSYSVNATAIVAGQHLPSHDPALVSRCVLVEFGDRPRPTIEEKQRMNALQLEEREGLTHLVGYLLQFRPEVEKSFRITFLRIYQRLLKMATDSEIPATDRVVEIHAALITPLVICARYISDGKWLDEDTLVGIAGQLLPLHAEASEAVDEVEHFWTMMDRAAALSMIRHGSEFMNEVREQSEVVLIRFRRIHTIYKEVCGRTGDKPLPEATIRRYLKKHKSFLGEEKVRFNAGGPTSVMVFNATEIDAKFWTN